MFQQQVAKAMPTETFECLHETSLKKKIDEITAEGGLVVAIVKQRQPPGKRRGEDGERSRGNLVVVDRVMQ